MIKIYIGVHVKYPLFLPDSKELQSSEFRKILKN
jgi:hypothetical protein